MVIGSIILIFLLNFILSFYFTRIDITDDKRYTLKEATIALLEDDEQFKDKLQVKLHFAGKLPTDWTNFRKEVMLKLEEYKVYGGDRFVINEINIYEDKSTLDAELADLRKLGLDEVIVSEANEQSGLSAATVPAIVLSYPGQSDVGVPLIPKSDIELLQQANKMQQQIPREIILEILDRAIIDLEFELTSAIKKIVTRDKPYIAFLEGHGELNKEQTHSARESLKEYYSVGDVDILRVVEDSSTSAKDQIFHSLDLVDLLMICQPKEQITEIEKFVIDQYIMKGGKVIWALDMVDVNLDTLEAYGATYGLPYENNLNLLEQLYVYGVRIEPSVVLDSRQGYQGPLLIPTESAPGKEKQVEDRLYRWEFFPLVRDWEHNNPNKEQHRITDRLRPIKMEYASYITPLMDKKDNVKKTVLLETSDSASYRRPPVDIFYNLVTQPKPVNQQYLPMAVLLEGEFNSLYKNRLQPKGLDNVKVKEVSGQNKMIVISDGDIFRNDIVKAIDGKEYIVDLKNSRYFDPNIKDFGNEDFLLNSVEYLLGETTLLDIRQKYVPQRLDMNKIAEQKSKWRFINIGLPLLIIIVVGVAQYFIRRQRYSN